MSRKSTQSGLTEAMLIYLPVWEDKRGGLDDVVVGACILFGFQVDGKRYEWLGLQSNGSVLRPPFRSRTSSVILPPFSELHLRIEHRRWTPILLRKFGSLGPRERP